VSQPADSQQAPLGAECNGLRSAWETLPRTSGGLGLHELATATPARDRFWEHAKNALGIARLLVHEARPAPLVDTACHAAIEAAGRAALEQAGMRFDGDTERSLTRLAAPRDLLAAVGAGNAQERLAACERVVAWVAAYLRAEAPERSWGY
jgi:hypothetical protein